MTTTTTAPSDAHRDVTVILAAAGGPATRPSWTLVLPDGRPALAAVVERLGCANVRRLVFVCLRSHVAEHCPGEDLAALIVRVNADLAGRVTVLALAEPTRSGVDTVVRAIADAAVTGPIFVKDADGAFDFDIPPGGSAGGSAGGADGGGTSYCTALRVHDGNIETLNDLTRKSFVQQCGGLLTNIVEKQIISDMICVGGYGFADAADYVAHVRRLEQVPATFFESGAADHHPHGMISSASSRSPSASAAAATRTPGVLFNSDVLLSMLAEGAVVACRFVDSFSDWKSSAGVTRYARSFRNVVVSLEDQLCERVPGNAFHAIELCAAASAAAASTSTTAELSSPTSPRSQVLLRTLLRVRDAARRELQHLRGAAGRCRVVVLCSLPPALEGEVAQFLRDERVPFDAVVCGMHSGGCVTSVLSL